MTTPELPTTEKLAAALEQIAGMPPEMIRKARDGYYDDFKSPLTFPINVLCYDLQQLANHPVTPRDSRPLLRALVDRVKAGDFDATKAEARAWGESPEGQAAWREVLDR